MTSPFRRCLHRSRLFVAVTVTIAVAVTVTISVNGAIAAVNGAAAGAGALVATSRPTAVAPSQTLQLASEPLDEEAYLLLGVREVLARWPSRFTSRELHEFRPGLEKILARRPVPVIPMALRGLWGSFFSAAGEGFFKHPFKRIWSKIEVVATPAWPPEQVQIGALQDYVLELRGDWR